MKTQSKPTQNKSREPATTQSVKHRAKNVTQPPVTSHRDKLRAFDWLIIDEFGFDKLERREISDALSLLYKVIDARVGRSTAVITNVDFKDWTDYLGDPQIVMAMLNRLVYRSQIVKFDGKSYRAASRPQGAKWVSA